MGRRKVDIGEGGGEVRGRSRGWEGEVYGRGEGEVGEGEEDGKEEGGYRRRGRGGFTIA